MRPTEFRALLCALCAFSIAFAAPRARAQDLLIGQVSSQTSPTTGANAKALYAGITAYFDYVNERGGVGGRKVKLVNKDDQLVPTMMIEQTNAFIADKNIMALAGYQNTG